jgi:nicotinamidase-related amidase
MGCAAVPAISSIWANLLLPVISRNVAACGDAMQTAILVIDMQVDYFSHERLARNRAQLTANTNSLLSVARENCRPVIWVKTEFAPDLRDALAEVRKKQIKVVIAGTAGAQLLPELDFQATDTLLVKKRYSAFYGTELEALLRAQACSRLVVCGTNTHACVRTTVVDAYQRDFEVMLAEGCIDSHDAEHHEVSWRYMNGKLAEALTVAEIGAILSQT